MRQIVGDAIRFMTLIRYSVKYRRFTMIAPRIFAENLLLAEKALAELPEGAVIECGTWKGGMAAALVEVGGENRRYYFFNSFEGLPPAETIDGPAAMAYQANPTSPTYFDNCRASIGDLKAALALTGCRRDIINIIPGFFEKSLINFEPPAIALLRLDADWYSSTMLCLKKFWDHILPGGLILIDDYYMWDGCARAVHDFLASVQGAERIEQGRISGVAYIRRRSSSGP